MFINSKSGGHAGPELTEVLYHTLGHAQVRSRELHSPGMQLHPQVFLALPFAQLPMGPWPPLDDHGFRS